MKAEKLPGGEDLIRELVGLLQRVFYPETVGVGVKARPFYQDLDMLRQAVAYPAAHIRDYGTGEFSAERYAAIFREIVQKVALHGTPAGQMRRRGAYILHVVQDHWRHHWETYRLESRTAGDRVAGLLEQAASRREIQAEAERPMALLAAVYDALKTGRPKKTKAAPARREIQEELGL